MEISDQIAKPCITPSGCVCVILLGDGSNLAVWRFWTKKKVGKQRYEKSSRSPKADQEAARVLYYQGDVGLWPEGGVRRCFLPTYRPPLEIRPWSSQTNNGWQEVALNRLMRSSPFPPQALPGSVTA